MTLDSDVAPDSDRPSDGDSSSEQASPDVPSRPVVRLIWMVMLLAATLIAYLPALRCGYIWDDEAYVQNFRLRDAEGLGRIWFDLGSIPQYYPLVHTTYWLERRLWGDLPAGYHLVNVLLHGLAAVLVYRILTGLRVPGAWLAAAVFALHPIQVESVAWITERKNVLSGVFYLLAMLAYFRFARLDESRPTENRGRWYGVSLLAFVCAMLSKTVTSTLPPALLLITWWKRGKIMWRDVLTILPFLVIGAPLGILSAWMEKNNVGAKGPQWDFSLLDRFLIAGRALWFYPAKLLSPSKLTFIYPRWEIDSTAAWQYVYPAAAIGVLVALWLARHRLGRGPLVGVLFYAGTLVPALGFFDVYPMRYSFVADHFQYLAGLGLVAVLAGFVGHRLASMEAEKRNTLGILVGIVLCVLGALTWMQCFVYLNLETLWKDTVRKNPGSYLAQNNLGEIYLDNKELELALPHFEAALKAKPDHASTHNNLGNIYQLQGKFEEAERKYRQAIKYNPDHPMVRNNLGTVLFEMKRNRAAEEQYNKALAMNPKLIIARGNLSDLLYSERRFAEAEHHLRTALTMEPTNRLLLQRLSQVMQARQRGTSSSAITPPSSGSGGG